MINSAGILFIYDHKALLMHPTNGREDYCMPPKGQIELGEFIFEAAIRETEEEVGIKTSGWDLQGDLIQKIEYKNKKGEIPKTVYIHIHHIKSLDEIGLTSIEIPTTQLQLAENDYGKFMDKDEIEKHCMWRYKDFVLNAIK